MNVCLDVRYKVESGASSYIRHVIPEILEHGRGHTFTLVKFPWQEFPFEKDARDVILSPGSDAICVLWTACVLPVLLARKNVDVYHAMKMPGPLFSPTKMVFTMHSIFDDYKGTFPVSWKTRLFLSLYGNRVVRRADRIVSVSAFLTECLKSQYGRTDEEVDTIYHGVAPAFRVLPETDVHAFAREKGWPPRYVLAVGNVTPVKNHVTAVRAFASLEPRDDLFLLIAGATENPYARKVMETARACGVADRVRLLGFVGGADLVQLMNGARVLWMPSLTEGCGLTVLEAFGCGVPVVASSRGGLWDVGQDACLFVDDPLDHLALAAHTREILADPRLRESLCEKSLAKASTFSWANAGRSHVRAYEKAVQPG